jgi:2'-5' RNA ligase
VTRAFVAICPPPPVLDAVEARTAAIDIPGARRTPREQWHITVQFLGNAADIDAVVGALSGLTTPAALVELVGAGAVGGTRNRGTVFALGARPLDWLTALADEVTARLTPLGYERDFKTYLPHLTLARCKRRTDMSGAVETVGPEPIGEPWRVDRMTVFESRTLREGAVHTPRGEVALTDLGE